MTDRASGTGVKDMVLKCKKCGADVPRMKHLEDSEHLCILCARKKMRRNTEYDSQADTNKRNRGKWIRG
jgi:hypothetical protein